MRKKLFFGMVSIGVLITLVMSMIVCLYNYRNIYEDTVQQNLALAETVSSGIDLYMTQISSTVKTIATAPTIKAAINEQNARLDQLTAQQRGCLIDDLSKQWIGTGGSAALFIGQYLGNETAECLQAQISAIPEFYSEILVTDKYGVLVAATNHVASMSFGDEYWWKASYDNGKGGIFFDDRGYDMSAGGYVLGISVPINDNDEVIGVLKCNINIMAFFKEVMKAYEEVVSPGYIRIVRSDGRIVFSSKAEPFCETLNAGYRLGQEDSKSFQVIENGRTEIVTASEIKKTLVPKEFGFGGTEHVTDNILGNSGQCWFLVYNMPESFVLSQMRHQTWILVLIDMILVGAMILLIVLFSKRLMKPVKELEAHILAVGSGNLNERFEINTHDEIERLADAFNRMTESLKQTMASKKEMENEIIRRNKAEKENAILLTRLVEQQKLQAISTLTSGIAHEINNPINGIMNYAQIIKEDLDEKSVNHRYAEEICAETSRVSRIILNLLQFSSTDNTMYLTSRITEIVKITLALIEPSLKKNGVALDMDIIENLPEIFCQRQQIQQVILNIIMNAITSMNIKYPDGNANKRIILSAMAVNKEGKEWVQVSVKDFGMGITDELAAHIFDPFFTTQTRAEARGLGLAVSYGIIKDHGGEIWFETAANEFTTFYFTLPVKTY